MKNDVDVRERVLNRGPIPQIAVHKLGVVVYPGRLAAFVGVRFEVIENPHVPALAHEQIGDVRTDEPGAASNESAFHSVVEALAAASAAQIRSRPSRAIMSAKNFLVAGATSPREFSPTNSSHKRRSVAPSSTS